MSHRDQYSVVYDGKEFPKGSSILTPAISKADPNICPKDEVMLKNCSGSLIGVGRARLSGEEMVKANYGVGISLRHKIQGV